MRKSRNVYPFYLKRRGVSRSRAARDQETLERDLISLSLRRLPPLACSVTRGE